MRLALIQPDIPQNVGACIRSAACFGAALDIIEPCGFPLTDKAVRRAAMDYGRVADVRRHVSWEAFAAHAAQRPHRLILLTTKGAEPLWNVTFQPDDILLCGQESQGAPECVHDAADIRAAIPLVSGVRSLNVAVAAGIALAEASRQCGVPRMHVSD